MFLKVIYVSVLKLVMTENVKIMIVLALNAKFYQHSALPKSSSSEL